MFANNKSLKTVSISGLTGENVTTFANAFAGDSALESVSISGLFGQLQDVSGMFRDCESLTSANVNFGLSNASIRRMNNMFESCKSMEYIHLDNIMVNDASVAGMFCDCSALEGVSFRYVSMSNTDINASNAMFNTQNSISSYHFADTWDVPLLGGLIMDHVHDATVTLDPITSIIKVDIAYSKNVPSWKKRQVEDLQNVEGLTHIFASEMRDIFVSKQDGTISFGSMVNIYSDLYDDLARHAELNNMPLSDYYEIMYISDTLFEFLEKASRKQVEYSDIAEVLGMTVEEVMSLFPQEE